jgi:sugar-specific transcriptional regulator TrmB
MNAYITASELMKIAPIKRTKAYEIIKAVNEELEAMGKITIRGKAPRGYTLEKLAIKKPADLGNRQARG